MTDSMKLNARQIDVLRSAIVNAEDDLIRCEMQLKRTPDEKGLPEHIERIKKRLAELKEGF